MWWKAVFVIISITGYGQGQVNLLGLGTLDVPLTDKLLNVVKPDKKCQPSLSIYANGLHPCKKELIFEDDFKEPFIDKKKWMVEQYTPLTHGPPDYEFVSYQKTDDTLHINDSKLIINPVPANSVEEVLGTLDLRDGCTSLVEEQCFYQQNSAFILPPVKSARISSKFSFTYGKIEVKAKLPVGDWIFPQLQLLPRTTSNTRTKMWIAYSRGNSYYIGRDGDVGNTVLFGGLVTGIDEPTRSRFTSKRKSVIPYGDDTYYYTLIWEPERLTALFNNITYGVYDIDKSDKRFQPLADQFYVSIGVGAGGINDFPDNYTSSNPKPWSNGENLQPRKFFDARGSWLPTWRKHSVELQIDSVKIWAL